MTAKELTKEYIRMSNDIQDMLKRLTYMENDLEKLRLIVEDMAIDVKMLNGMHIRN